MNNSEEKYLSFNVLSDNRIDMSGSLSCPIEGHSVPAKLISQSGDIKWGTVERKSNVVIVSENDREIGRWRVENASEEKYQVESDEENPWYSRGKTEREIENDIFGRLGKVDEEEDNQITIMVNQRASKSQSGGSKLRGNSSPSKGKKSIRGRGQIEWIRTVRQLKNRLWLLKGHVQSGKSALMRSIMIRGLRLGLSSIIVFRMTGESNQFRERLDMFRADLAQDLNGDQIVVEDLSVREASRALKPETYAEILRGENPKIVLCLGNETQLNIMNAAFESAISTVDEDESLRSYMLFVDEADYHSGSKGGIQTHAKKVLSLNTARLYAYAIFLVSATVMDTLCDEEIPAKQIKLLRPPKGYVGPLDLQPMITREWNTEQKGNLMTYDLDLYDIMDAFIKKAGYRHMKYKGKHPGIMLINICTEIAPMKQLMWDLRGSFPSLAVATYNGEGIILSSKHLDLDPSVRVHIPSIADETSSSERNSRNYRAHHFRGLTPQSLLLWMKRNGGQKKWSHIVFISGLLAGRSTSFATVDKEGAARGEWPHWHLVEQRLRIGKSSPSPNIIQYLRLCSSLPSPITRILHVSETDRETIVKSWGSHEDLVHLATLQDGIVNKEVMQELGLYKDKFPKGHKMTAKASFKPKRINDENDGGMSIDQYCFVSERAEHKTRLDEERKDREIHVSGNSISEGIYHIHLDKMKGKSLETAKAIISYLETHKNEWIALRYIVQKQFSTNEFEERRAITFHFTERYGSRADSTAQNIFLVRKSGKDDVICGRINS